MKITNEASDEGVLGELGRRLERVRLDEELTQAALAHEAGVSKRTVERIEAGHGYQLSSLLRVLRVLRLLDGLDVLVPDPSIRPMTLLEQAGKQRKRAPRVRSQSASTWTWGEDA